MPRIQNSTRLRPNDVGEVRVLPIKPLVYPYIGLRPIYLGIGCTCFVANSRDQQTQVS